MIAMAQRFLRQKFESPLVTATLAVLALLVASPPFLSPGPARLVALLLIASGSVSRDAASGALQMILARPITRTGYLGGRLLGIMAAWAIFLAAATLFAVVLAFRYGGTEVLRSWTLPRMLVGALLDGLQVAVLLLLFSTFLPAFGDALGFLFLFIAFSTASAFATASERRAWRRRRAWPRRICCRKSAGRRRSPGTAFRRKPWAAGSSP
jgi:ABC-type transport system involved in multi-copper enzyme maturation permease subunit